MPRDFFDPTPEQQNVVLVDAVTLRHSEKLIDNVLDRVIPDPIRTCDGLHFAIDGEVSTVPSRSSGKILVEPD
jgi:hypothetical protein